MNKGIIKNKILLGAHLSIAGGLHQAPTRGAELGCTVMQIFTANQRQWMTKPLSIDQIELFKSELAASPISHVLAHDSYLINLCCPDKNNLLKSRASFILEVKRANDLGVDGLIFHPGAHVGLGETQGLKLIAESINAIIKTCSPFFLKLSLETTAGQGTTLGYTFEQLQYIIDMVEEQDRMGVCIDTCHIFAAGYDIRTPQTYEKTMQQFGKIIGWPKLVAVHLNDSVKPLGSHLDRHGRIGKGEIGSEAFRLIMNDPRLSEVPKILEIPGGDDAFRDDLALLRNMALS